MEEIQQDGQRKHNGNKKIEIKEKIYEMILYGNPKLTDFPRTERYVLAGDIRRSMYAALELAVRLEKKYYKKTTLQDLDNEPKKRLIMSLPFKDRIVQWAMYRQLFPIYEKSFIYDSYACRRGKGTHKAADRLQYWLRQTERKPERYYYLKMDISKYFYRVDHEILLQILRRRIKDERLLDLLEKIINCESTKFGLPLGKEPDEVEIEDRLSDKGMPIGNLTSQMFANIYLNEVDQYANIVTLRQLRTTAEP